MDSAIWSLVISAEPGCAESSIRYAKYAGDSDEHNTTAQERGLGLILTSVVICVQRSTEKLPVYSPTHFGNSRNITLDLYQHRWKPLCLCGWLLIMVSGWPCPWCKITIWVCKTYFRNSLVDILSLIVSIESNKDFRLMIPRRDEWNKAARASVIYFDISLVSRVSDIRICSSNSLLRQASGIL